MSTPAFDRDAPYGDVTGLPGVRYYQAGNHFDAQGGYVSPETMEEWSKPSRQQIELEKEAKKEALKEAFKAERAAGTSINIVEPKPAPPAPAADPAVKGEAVTYDEDLETLHWTKLRKLVEEAGGEYKGKDDAVRFLQSRG